MKVLIDLHYFPNLEYFTILAHCDTVYIEKFETFQKQSFRNRCFIKTAQKVDRLSVPVVGANKGKPMRKIKVNQNDNWAIKHWRSILSAYGRSPFYEYYEEAIKSTLLSGEESLFELNISLLKCVIKLLGLNTKVEITENYKKETEDEVVDLRNKITATDSSTFVNEISYIQVFGDTFDRNLSILDLLFCEGPNAINILKSQNSQLIHH
ncbi:WbqC family protein [Flammeovirga sp. OC4]|uniref:WbqC family protein n=1 Tax=Flammeovirga sp. OC4 TaxID=1382345 RepID=UPI0005C50A8A|nr:WbqC family protein [Flammeovirga sp. OC4]